MEPGMRRFWIEFEGDERTPLLLAQGVGVTAESEDEALALVRSEVLRGAPLPAVARILRMSTYRRSTRTTPRRFERWQDD